MSRGLLALLAGKFSGAAYATPENKEGKDAATRRGSDGIYGGAGQDHIHGGKGDDMLYINDGQKDFVDCGPGRDEVYYDNRDYQDRSGELVGCEIGNPPQIP